jgi:hypothetical protein
MYCEEQTDLKREMKATGVTIKAVAQRLRRPYSTIGGMLGGFTPMCEGVRETIKSMIAEAARGTK